MLDDAAVTRVQAWRFKAARRAGEAVAVRMAIPIAFKL
jgi:TonB family protein